jgi:trans-L-3-hydroxyproline dehydratase
VTGVRFTNVPSFVAGLDLSVDVRGVGRVPYDLAYGGAFYAYVDATAVGLRLEAAEHDRIVDLGRRIKEAVQSAAPPVHPESEDLGFLYGTIFVGEAHDPDSHSRNVCVFADGEVDRSPTGAGAWRSTMRGASSPWGTRSGSRASSARPSTAACSERRAWGSTTP